MHCSSRRQSSMKKENELTEKIEEPAGRITRARAKAQGGAASKSSFKQVQKCVHRMNSKRASSDENKASVTATVGLEPKRRAVLKDVTNVCADDMHMDCLNAKKNQTSKKTIRDPRGKNKEMVEDIFTEIPLVEDVKAKLAEDLSKIMMMEAQESTLTVKLEKRAVAEPKCHAEKECAVPDSMPPIQAFTMPIGHQSPQNKEEDEVCKKLEGSKDVVDIDLNLKDPRVCSLYAPDIYNYIRVTELNRRPSTNYMEQVQKDITPSMRGILIDWLVEVSEEYKLVPDTLYLTVSLIDRFLSHNFIEKHRLQLLGVTCMLIASKYEEICAPRVEEFCFITDNTYTRGEVWFFSYYLYIAFMNLALLKKNQSQILLNSLAVLFVTYSVGSGYMAGVEMESKVLNFLYFHLSVPTTKTFLRRFIQAAQATYKDPCMELEFLANYLAELSLVEYNFLKFLPSLIAASAVFLARWTLNQSVHPWNPTLEHYTSYKASDLKTTVLALEELQLNTNGCSLNSIRDKYNQQKFKCVATMSSSERAVSVFSRR
ncbi:Cyclin-A2-1 [Hibiscus syriacus]|uniref:Cyclin-A2-1 n=1 Tax=Hibiscus syriacus TaxID=106335 RepID=A0A6A2X7A7_HIBSY|nr:Cyclin-A2-1 [Hibiscus syriacus]